MKRVKPYNSLSHNRFYPKIKHDTTQNCVAFVSLQNQLIPNAVLEKLNKKKQPEINALMSLRVKTYEATR